MSLSHMLKAIKEKEDAVNERDSAREACTKLRIENEKLKAEAERLRTELTNNRVCGWNAKQWYDRCNELRAENQRLADANHKLKAENDLGNGISWYVDPPPCRSCNELRTENKKLSEANGQQADALIKSDKELKELRAGRAILLAAQKINGKDVLDWYHEAIDHQENFQLKKRELAKAEEELKALREKSPAMISGGDINHWHKVANEALTAVVKLYLDTKVANESLNAVAWMYMNKGAEKYEPVIVSKAEIDAAKLYLNKKGE